MVNCELISFLGALKSAVLNKKYQIYFKYTKKIVPFLRAMVKRGVIRQFSIQARGSSSYLIIYLSYGLQTGKPLINDICVYTVGQRFQYMSACLIRKLYSNKQSGKFSIVNQDFFFLTNLGILSLTEMMKLNQGGALVCRVQYI